MGALLALLALVVLVVLLDVLHLPLLALVVTVDVLLQHVLLQHDLGSIALTLSLLCHLLHTGRCGVVLTPRDHKLGIGLLAEGGGGGGGMYILLLPLLLLLLLYVDIPLYEKIEQQSFFRDLFFCWD